MPVTLRQIAGALEIGVLGAVDAEDASVISDGLTSAAADQRIRLDIFDAEELPADLVLALADALARKVALAIYPYSLSLAGRLSRLGLPAQPVPLPPAEPRPERIAALALVGSANSLEPILTLVEHLPLGEASLFVLQHVAEDRVNLLDRLLQQKTTYRVLMPHHLTPVEPGTIYVAPPGHHMKIAHGTVYLTSDREQKFARPSIDELLFSLAEEYGPRAWAVVACGYGEDGPAGCLALRGKRGLVLTLDDPRCGEARLLPDRVRQAGASDQDLPLSALLSVCAAALAGPTPVSLTLFAEALWQIAGIDVRACQREALERRVEALMRKLGKRDFADFQRTIFHSAAARDLVAAEITIGVSEFFRHPAQFRAIGEELLPYLATFPNIKVWSAGCAAGEEAYSLAILLDRSGLAGRARIFATDANAFLLGQASTGLYPAAILEPGAGNFTEAGGTGGLGEHFTRHGQVLRIVDRIRASTVFFHHSLTCLAPFNQFELIICRNVLIYFEHAMQVNILQLFFKSLHPDGFLVLGPNDGLGHLARELGFVPNDETSHIYRKAADTDHG